jgi:hypothetical protein
MRSWHRTTTFGVAALSVCGCDLYQASRVADAGPAVDAGARAAAMVASCDTQDARRLLASHYDKARHCFARRAPLAELCAIPDAAGGGGELQCFVSPSGEAYGAYILYGETFTDPAWHHAQGPTLPSTLTESEMGLCASFWADFQRVEEVDTGARADDRLLWDATSSAELFPMCDASSE